MAELSVVILRCDQSKLVLLLSLLVNHVFLQHTVIQLIIEIISSVVLRDTVLFQFCTFDDIYYLINLCILL